MKNIMVRFVQAINNFNALQVKDHTTFWDDIYYKRHYPLAISWGLSGSYPSTKTVIAPNSVVEAIVELIGFRR